MKKLSLFLTVLFATVLGFAQDIYQMAEMSTADLNGTSRFVGMGGAMGALGGDISTMSTNPAAIGLFRRSDVAMTASFVSQPQGIKFDGKGKKYISFDQAGFVYAHPVEGENLKFINIGINYHKQRDFNQLLASSANNLEGAGYASQTWQLSDLCNYWGSADKATPLALMASEAKLLDASNGYAAYGAAAHYYNKVRWGSNQAFDFNLSANFNDRVYLGITATGYHVVQKNTVAYTEDLVDVDNNSDGYYTLFNDNSLKGTGFEAKFGIVFRPMLESNFKLGLTVSTPVYYDLTYSYESSLGTYENSWGDNDVYNPGYEYDYKIRTPWKFNFNIGNTFFNRLAVGAEYEYADFSACSVSYGDVYDDWLSTKDRELNREADKYLKSVHTFKIGAEFMATPNVFVRCGYNHVTSPFEKDAYLNQYINSASIDHAISTDYMNTSSINRFTAGIGLKFGAFYADAVWQYQNQHGNLYTFSASENGDYFFPYNQNVCPSKRINLNKYRIALTAGYRF